MKENLIDVFEVFPWNKNFETKIIIIDEQHQKLVALLNQLASHLANQSSSITLNSIFDELAHYADYHFKTEETIWAEYFINDPWYKDHQRTHKSFIDKVIALKNNKSTKSLDEVVADIVRFLTRWLAFHILDSDRRMAIATQALKSGMAINKAKNHADETMKGSIDLLIDTVLMMYDNLSTRTLALMQEKIARQRLEEQLQIDEERWKFVMESSGDNVWEWNMGKGHIYRSENSQPILDIFGDDEDPVKRTLEIHPNDLVRIETDLQAHFEGKTDFFSNKHRVLDQYGVYSWVLTRGKIISRDSKERPLRMIGIHINTTEREIASLLYQNSSEGMMVTDADKQIISINPAFTEITGYNFKDVVGKKPNILKSDRHSKEFYQSITKSLEEIGQWRGEIWNKRKNGSIYPEWLTINRIYNPDKSIHYYTGFFTDITERKLIEDAIWKQANFDSLTQLPNRQLFYDRFSLELKLAYRHQYKLALLFIDLDHFKEVNDSLGHSYGDLLLIEVSRRLKSCVRESDTVARLSGDEFTIILNKLESLEVIDRIVLTTLEKLQAPFHIDNEVIFISASIGITLYPEDGMLQENLLRNADQAMYQAKKNGRNCSAFFTSELQKAAQYRMHITKDLRRALINHEFQLFYQPIVDLKTGEINKAEALIRWQHASRGLVLPDEFISIAENTGIIHEIGDWIFHQAAQQVATWQQRFSPNFQISINKSPVQFQGKCSSHIDWLVIMEQLNLTGDSIVIEITEGLLLETNESVQHKLNRFIQANVQISLDDFGTGFSSLAYLQKFDIDYIKIDKSFVSLLTPTSKDLALCKAMIMMAHALDIKVIAEGIETEMQKELLISIDCDYGQGYLFSKPIIANSFEKLLKDSVVNNIAK